MKFPLAFAFLPLIPGFALGNWMYYGDDLSYADIISMNASCYPKDSCQEERPDDSPGIGYGSSCSCNRQCSKYGTCCIDSPYRDYSTPLFECRRREGPYPFFNYLVTRCPDRAHRNSVWRNLCEEQWNGEDDITKIALVTSLDTNTTYQNYYCFKCHESTDNFFRWNLHLKGIYEDSYGIPEDGDYRVTYNRDNQTWMATSEDESASVPVNIQFLYPDDKQVSLIPCDPYMISNCSDTSTDKNIRDKCNAYTAKVFLKYNPFSTYKNPHCALCNNKTLDDISCDQQAFGGGFGYKEMFSFSHLLDINRADKAEKSLKCEESELWDPYGKKCRKVACALPGHVIKNGRCTRS